MGDTQLFQLGIIHTPLLLSRKAKLVRLHVVTFLQKQKTKLRLGWEWVISSCFKLGIIHTPSCQKKPRSWAQSVCDKRYQLYYMLPPTFLVTGVACTTYVWCTKKVNLSMKNVDATSIITSNFEGTTPA
jgi:hypothetical protein